MKAIEINKNRIRLEISRLEISMLNNALNEVCYGIEVENFESQVGMKTEDAKVFLDKINLGCKKLSKLSTDYQT